MSYPMYRVLYYSEMEMTLGSYLKPLVPIKASSQVVLVQIGQIGIYLWRIRSFTDNLNQYLYKKQLFKILTFDCTGNALILSIRLQLERSNSDHQSRRRAHRPLDHHHGPCIFSVGLVLCLK